MSVLEEFYYGDLVPQQKYCNKTPEWSKLMNSIAKYEDMLEEMLHEEEYKIVENLIEATAKLYLIQLEECFEYGWKLSAKFLFETFINNQ